MSDPVGSMRIAAESIRHTSMYETFVAGSVSPGMPKANLPPGEPDPLHRDLSDEDWAQGMSKAFSNPSFARFAQTCIDVAHRDFAGRSPVAALSFELNGTFPDDHPLSVAITRAYNYLVQDRQEPRWQALLLFSLARMIAVNATKGYKSKEWTQVTLHYFALEKSLLSGDGTSLAKGIVELDKWSGKNLADVVGHRMLHALAEAAINAGSSSMFNRTQ
jgi:hypothetical protein